MTTPNPIITQDALAHLGDGRLAYVKAIRSEDVAGMFPQAPEIAPGRDIVCAACGRWHADHAHRHARIRAGQRLEPRARSRERALKRVSSNDAVMPRKRHPVRRVVEVNSTSR